MCIVCINLNSNEKSWSKYACETFQKQRKQKQNRRWWNCLCHTQPAICVISFRYDENHTEPEFLFCWLTFISYSVSRSRSLYSTHTNACTRTVRTAVINCQIAFALPKYWIPHVYSLQHTYLFGWLCAFVEWNDIWAVKTIVDWACVCITLPTKYIHTLLAQYSCKFKY